MRCLAASTPQAVGDTGADHHRALLQGALFTLWPVKNSSPATPGACYNTNGVLEFDVLNPVTPKKGVSALLASALKDSCVSVVSHRNVLHHGEFMRCPGTSEFELLLSASPDTVPVVNMVC